MADPKTRTVLMSDDKNKVAETPDEALAKAEMALQIEADNRLRDVKAEAATNTKAAGEAKKPANPDG